MGLTRQSVGTSSLRENFAVSKKENQFVVALAGNPNTGKSTVFNALTGLNQHTGNWPGKTVLQAQGNFTYLDQEFILVDLPGTYSLLANSVEEQVARDFICFAEPHATVVVTDATCLERNLNLVLQVTEITDRVVICVNLMDEARRKKIQVDLDRLSKELGVPVVGTAARNGEGLQQLQKTIHELAKGKLSPKPVQMRYDDEVEKTIDLIEPMLQQIELGNLNTRWLALRLVDGDLTILEGIEEYLGVEISQSLKSEVLAEWARA